MSIEISNKNISELEYTNTPQKDQHTREAQAIANSSQQASGKPVKTISITENAKKLNQLQQELAQQPALDTAKLDKIRLQIQNKNFKILQDSEHNSQQYISELRSLANKIIDLNSKLPDTMQLK